VHTCAMKPVKAMTIRLSPEQAEELETIANVVDLPVSEVVRAAIAEHIEARRQDEGFRRNLRDRLDRAQRLLGE
jgi:predicted transcriptional regulator